MYLVGTFIYIYARNNVTWCVRPLVGLLGPIYAPAPTMVIGWVGTRIYQITLSTSPPCSQTR